LPPQAFVAAIAFSLYPFMTRNIQETSMAAGIATMSTRLRGHVVVFDEIDPVAIENKKLPIDPDPRPTIVYTALGFGL
jgi:hypothetical protein